MTARLHLSVQEWLRKLDLLIYHDKFKIYNGVEDMLHISEGDMKNMGILNGSHRARLASSLTILKEKYKKILGISSPNRQPNLTDDINSRSFESVSPHQKIRLASSSGVRSWPSSSQSSLNNTRHSSHRSSMEGHLGFEATPEDLQKALEWELSLDGSDLRSYPWYHGTILRQRAEDLVMNNGDFIVRDCISLPGDFVVTCKWEGVPLHFIINKVISQPDTIYEKIQYCFEGDSFDSISDFITYYVGSKCPLSSSCGAIISTPINRSMPLSYYATRYGVHCQIQYAAKALATIPPEQNLSLDSYFATSSHKRNPPNHANLEPKSPPNVASPSTTQTSPLHKRKLVKVSSDPSIDLNVELKTLEHRPNSGIFTVEMENKHQKPPPKPSRVPSRKLAQRPPFLLKWQRKNTPPSLNKSDNDECEIFMSSQQSDESVIGLHQWPYQRMISGETRFSFLDRASLSSEGSLCDGEINNSQFTIPSIMQDSCFDPQKFQSSLLFTENKPLEASVLCKIREYLLTKSAKELASHLTRVDLEISKNFDDGDLGLGVTSGFELILLPQGQQLINDLLERSSCMKLLVAISILTSATADERVSVLNKWIEVAIEAKKSFGNLYGFAGIMLGLSLPQISCLLSTWLHLRRQHTENAFDFETKLFPALKEMQGATVQIAPNTCIPYILSLLCILKCHMNNKDNTDLEELDFDIIGEQNSCDYGLQVIENHLLMSRDLLQQWPVFRNNASLTLGNVTYEKTLLEIFKTELHLRLFWGWKGSAVDAVERHNKFEKVLDVLAKRCQQV